MERKSALRFHIFQPLYLLWARVKRRIILKCVQEVVCEGVSTNYGVLYYVIVSILLLLNFSYVPILCSDSALKRFEYYGWVGVGDPELMPRTWVWLFKAQTILHRNEEEQLNLKTSINSRRKCKLVRWVSEVADKGSMTLVRIPTIGNPDYFPWGVKLPDRGTDLSFP
jgi:hypothetical protein